MEPQCVYGFGGGGALLAWKMYVPYCMYDVRFEWDEAKNKTNLRKHGVDFETAQLIFDDPFCVSFVESVKDGRNAGTRLE